MEELLNTYLPILAIAAIVIVIVIYAVILNKKLNSDKKDVKQSELDERRRSVKVNKVSGFIPPKISAFYEVLKVAMPAQYVILPNIAIELLFQRANRKDLCLTGQYATFCIFTAKFAPVLVIELVDYSVATDAVFIIPPKIKEMLRNSGIPVLEYAIRDTYSIDDLRMTISKAMNPLL